MLLRSSIYAGAEFICMLNRRERQCNGGGTQLRVSLQQIVHSEQVMHMPWCECKQLSNQSVLHAVLMLLK
jgi:hypothetical protein